MEHRLISRVELKEIFGIRYTPQHLGRLMRLNKFPQRIKWGNRNYWKHDEIVAFVKSLG